MIETVRPSRLRRIRHVVAALTTMLFGVAVVSPATARAGDEVFASVGTGELNGVYYPAGKAICEIVNRDLSIDGVRCSLETTPGSVYNIHALQSGKLEFGIVQADVNFNAYKGQGGSGRGRCSGLVAAGAAASCARGTTRWDCRATAGWGRLVPPLRTPSRGRGPAAAVFGTEMPWRSCSSCTVSCSNRPRMSSAALSAPDGM